MGKQIINGAKAREEIIKGIDILAGAVKVTLGPRGRNVAIGQSFGPPRLTKDGVTVANAVKLKDNFHNLGAQLIHNIAAKTAEVAGDGTTTATVLAQAIVKEGNKAVVAGFNPMDIKRGIDLAVTHIIDYIKRNSKIISTPAEIAQVGTISANGDKEIGEKIAEAVQKVGKEGVITVEESKHFGFEVDVVEGMRFDKGYLSPYFVTNSEKMLAELENPLILIFDKKLAALKPMLPLLENVVQSGRPILIIAEDVEGEVLATLVLNKLRGGLKIVAVKAPSFGEYRRDILDDIALLTGAQVIGEDQGLKLESIDMKMIGTVKRAVITKEHTTLIGGIDNKELIEARCVSIRKLIEEAKSEYEKNPLKERLAKLTGGVAVLRVGGATEVEMKECKDRVDDALHATRAAIEEGIMPGGGTTFFYAAQTLEYLGVENEDQQIGVNIIKRVLEAPLRQIVDNACMDAAIVVGKLRESIDNQFGFDAQKLEYVNMIDAGIIDPTKVLCTALKDASSIASLIVTTEAVIVDEPKSGQKELPPGAALFDQ